MKCLTDSRGRLDCNTRARRRKNVGAAPVFSDVSSKMQPVFFPSRPWIGPIAVPFAGEKQKGFSGVKVDFRCVPGFKGAFSRSEVQERKILQHPAITPDEGVSFGMGTWWVRLPRRDDGVAYATYVKPPAPIRRRNREVVTDLISQGNSFRSEQNVYNVGQKCNG